MAALPVSFGLEPRYKEQFAAFLHEGRSPLIAALSIWGQGQGAFCATIAAQWEHDPYVTAYREKLASAETAEVVSAKVLTTKLAQVKRIEKRAATMMDDDTWLKAERLIAEMSGHIEKAAPPSVVVDNRSQTIERVMVVKDYGEDSNWEDKLKSQQFKLVEGSRS